MTTPMHVYVSEAELDTIRRLYADADITQDNTKLAGFLAGCSLANGGDFNRTRALCGVSTELRVLKPAEHVKINVTVVREELINGQETEGDSLQ